MATAKRVRSTRAAAARSPQSARTTRTAKPAAEVRRRINAVQIDIETIKAMRVLLGGQGVIVPNPPRPKTFTIIIEGTGVVRPAGR